MEESGGGVFASEAVYTEQSGFSLRAMVCPVSATGQASVQLQRDEGFSYTTNVPLLCGALPVTSCSLLRGEVTPQRRPRCWMEGERADTHLQHRHKATFRLGCCAHVPSCELLAWRGPAFSETLRLTERSRLNYALMREGGEQEMEVGREGENEEDEAKGEESRKVRVLILGDHFTLCYFPCFSVMSYKSLTI